MQRQNLWININFLLLFLVLIFVSRPLEDILAVLPLSLSCHAYDWSLRRQPYSALQNELLESKGREAK